MTASFAEYLPALLEEQGGAIAELTAAICLNAAVMAWDHRDPFDRLRGATAIQRAFRLFPSTGCLTWSRNAFGSTPLASCSGSRGIGERRFDLTAVLPPVSPHAMTIHL